MLHSKTTLRIGEFSRLARVSVKALRLYDRLGLLEPHGIRSSSWISFWHDQEYKDEDVDGEAALATEDLLPEDGRVRGSELPAVESMAATVHHGSFDTIGGAYAALLSWIEENGYGVADPNREVYLRGGGEQDNLDYVTEIQFPVEKLEWRNRCDRGQDKEG